MQLAPLFVTSYEHKRCARIATNTTIICRNFKNKLTHCQGREKNNTCLDRQTRAAVDRSAITNLRLAVRKRTETKRDVWFGRNHSQIEDFCRWPGLH